MSDSSSRKRKTKQLGTRIDAELKAQFDEFCAANGMKPQFVVEGALTAWLETHGQQPRRPLPTHRTHSLVHDRKSVERD